MNKELNELAKSIYAQNVSVGWWDDEPCIYSKIQLIVTEIAEATEGERKDLMDDHLPHRKMGEVELADTLIRTLDLGEHLGLKIVDDEYMSWANEADAAKHHLLLVECVINFYQAFRLMHGEGKERINNQYSLLCNSIIHVSKVLGYEIFDALKEKLEYNMCRADHRRENRAKANGKKF